MKAQKTISRREARTLALRHMGRMETARLPAANHDSHDDLLTACKALLEYANRYSDEMRKIGRGAEQLGTLADSASVAGMARAAIASAEGGAA